MPKNLKPSSHPNLLSFLDFFGQEMRLLKQFQPLWFVALFLPNWQKSNIKICPCQYSVKSILWFSRSAEWRLWKSYGHISHGYVISGSIFHQWEKYYVVFVRFTTYQQVATAAFMYWNVLHTSHSVGYLIGRSSHAFSEPNTNFFFTNIRKSKEHRLDRGRRGGLYSPTIFNMTFLNMQ